MAEHGNVTVFVACDKVIQEANTNKKSLIGMFKNFNFAQLPGRLPQWFLYAQISDLEEGEYNVTLNIDGTQHASFILTVTLRQKQ